MMISNDLRHIDVLAHWRFFVTAALCAAAAALIAYALSADVLPLLVGSITGLFLGALFGTIWHLSDAARHPRTSKTLFAVALPLLALVSLTALAFGLPLIIAQHEFLTLIHTLGAADISRIQISSDHAPLTSLNNQTTRLFTRLLISASTFTPNHETASRRGEILFASHAQSLEFAWYIPATLPNDVVIQSGANFHNTQVLIPNASVLLSTPPQTAPQ
ncbi:MAG TPA: hypothetical protein VHQ47_01630 [Phycisphaerae bacterium]|nr:hypothetical protein [Phycisphaerae bacterium]